MINGNCALVAEVELEHNNKNIEMVSKRYIQQLGKIIKTDNSSDCITLVSYERGTLGFSI